MKRIVTTLALLCALVLGPGTALAQEKRGAGDENRVIDAVQRYCDGDADGVIALLKDTPVRDPENDAAWFYLGQAWMMKQDGRQAEACLKKAAELDPGNYWYQARLAHLYLVTDRPELAVGIYERLLREYPKKSELYFQLANLYVGAGEMDKALATLDEIETVMGKNDGTVMARFNILRQLNRPEEAYAVLKSYAEEYASPQVLTLLGDYEMGMFNDSTALARYDEALSLDKSFPPARLGKAEVYRLMRRYPDWFAQMQDLMADDEIEPQAKSSYLEAVIRNMDPRFLQTYRPQLDSTMALVLAHHPQDSSVVQTAGLYYYAAGDKEKSGELFRTNMENHPDSPEAAASYLQLLSYLGDWEAMSRESLAAWERFPQETDFLEMANFADYNRKDYAAVIDHCEKMLAAVPSDSARTLSAYSTIGDMYHLLGEGKKAYKAYGKALKVNPDYNPVLNNYAYYLSEEGRSLKKAYRMSKKTVETDPDNATYLDTFGWILHLMGRDLEAKPFFKHAMLYGGKDSRTILEHYAVVLEALGESDMARVYRSQAETKTEEP